MQPKKYERSTDFTERDGSDTDHSAVNQEFDAAAISVNQIRENLAKIQNDDGGLNSGIVTKDAIDSSVFDEIGEVIAPLVQDAQEAATSSINAATAASNIKDQTALLKSQTETAANAASLSATSAAGSAQSANQSKLAAEEAVTSATNASRLTIGAVSTSNGSASATITGTPGNQVLNIAVPKGDKGSDGATWRSGAGVPASSLGANNDYYLNTITSDVYQKSSGTYAIVCNIKGADGGGSGTIADGSITPIKLQTGVDFSFNGVTVGRGGGNSETNTAGGYQALFNNITGFANTASGYQALFNNITGFANTASGYQALYSNTGAGNTANGYKSLRLNTTGNGNTANGTDALCSNTTGGSNTANGTQALYSNTTGGKNTASGQQALRYNATGTENTANGYQALYAVTEFTNCSGFGANSAVTASNQVQLGDSATTTYVYGTVQNRSDLRDKTDVRNTLLGLEFINKLRAVDYKWDMREDYKDSPDSMPKAPEIPDDDATDEAKEAYELAKAEFEKERDAWLEKNKLSNITRDGSKKRNRWHHGLIAQEVKATIDESGIDFGGYQDHSMSDGDDVLSIGYDELIAPLIKAVQELSAEVVSLKSQISALNK